MLGAHPLALPNPSRAPRLASCVLIVRDKPKPLFTLRLVLRLACYDYAVRLETLVPLF